MLQDRQPSVPAQCERHTEDEHPRATLGQADRCAPSSTLMRISGGAHHRQIWCVLSGPPPCYPMTLDVYRSMSSEGGKPTRRGGEMSQSPKTSAATPDVIQGAEPNVLKDGMSHALVLITQQEV